MVKDFFYHRVRPNLFADRVDTELRGRFFLVAQTCFLQGILFVDYVQDVLPETFEQTSPYILLLAGTTVVGGYYLAKLCLYHSSTASSSMRRADVCGTTPISSPSSPSGWCCSPLPCWSCSSICLSCKPSRPMFCSWHLSKYSSYIKHIASFQLILGQFARYFVLLRS